MRRGRRRATQRVGGGGEEGCSHAVGWAAEKGSGLRVGMLHVLCPYPYVLANITVLAPIGLPALQAAW